MASLPLNGSLPTILLVVVHLLNEKPQIGRSAKGPVLYSVSDSMVSAAVVSAAPLVLGIDSVSCRGHLAR